MLTITYIVAVTIHIYAQGRLNNDRTHSLHRILLMATSVVGVMKMGNIVPRVRIEPTCLAFWASVLTIIPPMLPVVTLLPKPTCI